MHSFPSERRPPRPRPGHRLPRGVVSTLLAVSAAVGAAGCAPQGGVRDDGTAPTLSAPSSAVPLWPGYTPPFLPAATKPPSSKRYLPVKNVQVPARGLAALSAKTLLEHDPNVPEAVHKVVSTCTAGGCPLRDAVRRDLTGDGRAEMVVAVDLPEFERTLLQVYSAAPGRTVRLVLIYWGPLGLTGDTFGRDLLITATGNDGRFTTRFRWNGDVMAAVTPEGAADPPRPADGGITPGTGPSTDTRTTP